MELFPQMTNVDQMDLPSDLSGLPSKICWNAELPGNIRVPRVDIHSLILDFSAVSFLDISSMKGLKAVQNHSSDNESEV